MFWKYIGIIILLIISFIFVFKTEDIKNFSWAIRHGVDEEGEKQQIIALKALGFMFFVIALVWMFT